MKDDLPWTLTVKSKATFRKGKTKNAGINWNTPFYKEAKQ